MMTKNKKSRAWRVGARTLTQLGVVVVVAMARPGDAQSDEGNGLRLRMSGRADEALTPRKLRHGLYVDLMLHSGFQPRRQPDLCQQSHGDAQCIPFANTPGFGATFRLGYQVGWIGGELVGSGMVDLHYGSLPAPPRPAGLPEELGGTVDELTTQRFLVYNFGVFVGAGPRLTTPGRAAFTLGITPGMAFRWFNVARVSATESHTVGESQHNFGLLMDAGLLVGGRGSKLSLGVLVWLDFLGADPSLPAAGDAGRYTVGRSPSIFVGPSLGVHWGGA